MCLSPIRPDPAAGTDAATAEWVPVDEALAAALAFDHHQILSAALDRAGHAATSLAGPDFTLGELQHVYEAVWGQPLDRANFRRKVLATDGFVVETGDRRTGKWGGAPGKVYCAGAGGIMDPPLMREEVRL